MKIRNLTGSDVVCYHHGDAYRTAPGHFVCSDAFPYVAEYLQAKNLEYVEQMREREAKLLTAVEAAKGFKEKYLYLPRDIYTAEARAILDALAALEVDHE